METTARVQERNSQKSGFRIPLAFWFLLPSLIAILLFFFLPVILTFAISFTNMGSETGISGSRYVFSQDRLEALKARQLDPELLSKLSSKRYLLDSQALERLRTSRLKPKVVQDIEKKLSGKTFTSEAVLNRALKKLKNRPRSFTDRKLVAKAMFKSIADREFTDGEGIEMALKKLAIEVSPEQLELILEVTNTSWTWTLNNYKEVFAGQFSGLIALNTVFYVVGTLLFFNIGLALFIALLTFYVPERQSKFFRAVWLIPRISPVVLYIVIWKWMGSNIGPISYIVGFMGIEADNWILEFPWAFVFLTNGFVGASMGMIIFSSAMQAIPQSMIWASVIDGANKFQQIKRIILPQLKWPILFITSYQTLSLLTSFEYIQLLTNGGPGFFTTEVWSLYAFHQALFNYFGNLRYGFGSALAVGLVIIGVTASSLYLKFFHFNDLVQEPQIES
jgi:inositol-phosphate transport system permease protein